MTRVVNPVRFPIDEGIVPFRLFLKMSNSIREGIAVPMFEGIGPESSSSSSKPIFKNQSGNPRIIEYDGLKLCLIPEPCREVGAELACLNFDINEFKPRHPVETVVEYHGNIWLQLTN
ncbi:Hypothetical predicted protein [Olea europaea subsp. europaea]|uniref:Uncharacterized protein n=1 Tax=Olea europaea subsp. europaea TaxID=158383 RepID=A0A8S0QD11_OLEEU|nr:Hypothetical predicted protein [Olea europaea subsp. europaea]